MRYAGVGPRAAAVIIDGFICFVVLGFVVAALSGTSSP